jgi:hypothetical protein
MKKLSLLLFVLPVVLFAKSYLVSDVPLPKTYIQNLDPYPCDEKCLEEYLAHDMIFSFLSHATSKLQNQELENVRLEQLSILNIKSKTINNIKVRIALLLPYKIIKRYAKSTTNSVFAYLLTKNSPFEIKAYKIENQSKAEIQKALQKISDDGFEYIIAPMTLKGLKNINEINPQINIYFPTINSKSTDITSPYFTYGAIDYKAQTDVLLQEAVSPLVILHDKSAIGKNLSLYQSEKFREITDYAKVIQFSISKKQTNLQWQFKKNKRIVKGSFFINTPIVKTGMIMSQITLYDRNATNILSTQINYNPLLLSITQYEDRKHMIIANSITNNSDKVVEANAILGTDITYTWINYTTTVGADYFYSLATNNDREYPILIKENQLQYPIELVKPLRYKFVKKQPDID